MKDLSLLQPKKILVRMPNWIGDFVMATAVLKDLRDKFPQAEITAMCKTSLSPLLLHDPSVNEVFGFKNTKRFFFRRDTQNNIRKALNTGSYDIGILLTNSFSSAWWLWQGGVKYRLGYVGNYRSILLTHRLRFPEEREDQHLTLTYKQLLGPLGIVPSSTAPELTVTDKELKKAYTKLSKHGIFPHHTLIGINPGAAYGSAKCWPPERFRSVASLLLEKDSNIRIVFFADGAGVSLVNTICLGMPPGVVNLAGQTNLRELMASIKLCHALLTNDSGPMHLADALGVPLVALFGSTNPITTGPFKQRSQVIQKKVDCSPCYKRTCPIDFRCMTGISPEEVFKKLQRLLNL
ncbi:MAG: lipopolysaccharide heptosyltransferase II [Chlamydiota bacterium]